MRSLALLLLAAGALPLAAEDLRTGQLLTSGYYSCNRDATDARNGMNVYERTGYTVHTVTTSPGPTPRLLTALGSEIVGVIRTKTESSIGIVDADGHTQPFTSVPASIPTSYDVVGLAPAGRDALYAMVVGTAQGLDFNSAEVWRIERAAGTTLKRPLAVPPGNFFPTVTLDTDASGCTVSYAGGRSQNGDVSIVRFNACLGTSAGTAATFHTDGNPTGIRILPDGGFLVALDDSLDPRVKRYDRNGSLVKEIMLRNVLGPSYWGEYFPQLAAVGLDSDPHLLWMLVWDGNPCGGTFALLVNLDTGALLNMPHQNFNGFSQYVSAAVAGGWAVSTAPATPPRRRAVR